MDLTLSHDHSFEEANRLSHQVARYMESFNQSTQDLRNAAEYLAVIARDGDDTRARYTMTEAWPEALDAYRLSAVKEGVIEAAKDGYGLWVGKRKADCSQPLLEHGIKLGVPVAGNTAVLNIASNSQLDDVTRKQNPEIDKGRMLERQSQAGERNRGTKRWQQEETLRRADPSQNRSPS